MQERQEIQADHTAETLILSLDFDGCTDTLKARNKLIQFMTQYCIEHPQYKTIAIAIGSLRQFVATDYYNARMHYARHGNKLISCSLLLNEFTQALSTCLQQTLFENAPTVKRITMLTSDIFNHLEIGTTFKEMNQAVYHQISSRRDFQSIPVQDRFGRDISQLTQKEFQTWSNDLMIEYDDNELDLFLSSWSVSIDEFEDYKEWREDWRPSELTVQNQLGSRLSLLVTEPNGAAHEGHSVLFDDTSKIMTLYILHHFIMNRINKPFDLLHFDDRTDLLDPIDSFYQAHPTLLPKGARYKSIEWNTDVNFNPSLTTVRPTIQGIGPFNPNYANSVQAIAKTFFPTTCPPTAEVADRLRTYCLEEIAPVKSNLAAPTHEVVSDLTVFRPKPRYGKPGINPFKKSTKDETESGEKTKQEATRSASPS
ncbi:MAG: hypothetical protein K0U37_04475 [Gammaproteobacteria bacterium]|nr:hypothetical protein [Gammaproteobacteria bacterium]